MKQNTIFDKQKLSLYESLSNNQILSESGIIFNEKTDFAIIALAQELEIDSLYNSLLESQIGINVQGQITDDIFFCMYKKLKYVTGMYFTITNPIFPYSGCEVLVYSVVDDNIVELSYQTPYIINTFTDITSIKYLEKSNQIQYCSEYYESLTIRIFEQMLSENYNFEIWNGSKRSENESQIF